MTQHKNNAELERDERMQCLRTHVRRLHGPFANPAAPQLILIVDDVFQSLNAMLQVWRRSLYFDVAGRVADLETQDLENVDILVRLRAWSDVDLECLQPLEPQIDGSAPAIATLLDDLVEVHLEVAERHGMLAEVD